MVPEFIEGVGDATGRSIERPEGFLTYRFTPADGCELVNFSVNEEYRSQGIGWSMVSEVESIPTIKTIYGFTRDTNLRVHEFYHRHGYTLLNLPDFYGPGLGAVMVHKVLR